MFLDPTNPLNNNVEFRGVCLVGFDYDGYPSEAKKATLEELRTEIAAAAADWYSNVSSTLSDPHKLETFTIEFFILPVPSVEILRETFLKTLAES